MILALILIIQVSIFLPSIALRIFVLILLLHFRDQEGGDDSDR